MLRSNYDRSKSTHKAEIIYQDNWVEFYILNNNNEEYYLTESVIDTLPKTLKGRFVTNTIGYNPAGWFSDITKKKDEIRFTKIN